MPSPNDIAEIRASAERIAEILTKGQHQSWELGIADDETREAVVAAATDAGEAIVRGDFDLFKFSVATVVALEGLVPGGRRKWAVADAAGDVLWRVNRDAMKAEIAAGVEALIGEILDDR